MRRQFLHIVPVLLHIEELVEVNTVVHPLWLHVLLCLHVGHVQVLSVCDHVGDVLVVLLELESHCAAQGQDNILQGLSGDLRAEIKVKS